MRRAFKSFRPDIFILAIPLLWVVTVSFHAQALKCEGRPLQIETQESAGGTSWGNVVASFLRKHKDDPLVSVWPKSVTIAGIIKFGDVSVYELTCDEPRPFHPLELGNTYLVYEDERGSLARVNVRPRYWGAVDAYPITDSEPTIKAFTRFARRLPAQIKRSLREKCLYFLCLVYHYSAYEYPCIVLTTDELSQPPDKLDDLQRALLPQLTSSKADSTHISCPRTYEIIAAYRTDNALVKHVFSLDGDGNITQVKSVFLKKFS